jgi:hypothetical protein
MDTIKKVFSEAYYPEKYMKEDNHVVDNSINYAQPYESDLSKSLILEEVKRYYSEKAEEDKEDDYKEDSFQYEGGDHTYNLDSSKDVTHRPELPPIKMEEIKRFDPELTDNIFNSLQSQRNISDRPLNSARGSARDSAVNNENDDDLSVYEVQSDDQENTMASVNTGLMESESRSNGNLKMMIIFGILFGILIFSAAI